MNQEEVGQASDIILNVMEKFSDVLFYIFVAFSIPFFIHIFLQL